MIYDLLLIIFLVYVISNLSTRLNIDFPISITLTSQVTILKL